MPVKYITVLLLCLSTHDATSSLSLEILPKHILHGAACLDGSSPAIYFSPATTPAAETKWVLYLKGGGWCVNSEDCLTRATTSLLGSSTKLQSLQPTFTYGGGGPLGNSSVLNPTFSTFNKALFWYCDGGSFAGDRQDTIPVIDNATHVTHNLYYRGKKNLDAMLLP